MLVRELDIEWFERSEASEEILIFVEDAKRALQTAPEDGERGGCALDRGARQARSVRRKTRT